MKNKMLIFVATVVAVVIFGGIMTYFCVDNDYYESFSNVSYNYYVEPVTVTLPVNVAE